MMKETSAEELPPGYTQYDSNPQQKSHDYPDAPPDYDTLINIPDRSAVPPPPQYQDPVLEGLDEQVLGEYGEDDVPYSYLSMDEHEHEVINSLVLVNADWR